MNHKKTVGIYFIIIWMLVLIYLSFVGFYIVLISGMIDGINILENNPEVVSVEVAGSEVLPIETEVDSVELPLLSLGLKKEVEEVEEVKEVKGKGQVMEISAYNLVEEQCDNSPLIGAFGDNLMELMDQGIQVCASNAFSKGTRLQIQGFGKCVVMDRMNSKYKNHVDICMGMNIEQALSFGRRNLKVSVIY